jgi:hypothetical protein
LPDPLRDCVVRRGIRGLDPNRDRTPQLRKWLKTHRCKRALTDAERVERRKRIGGGNNRGGRAEKECDDRPSPQPGRRRGRADVRNGSFDEKNGPLAGAGNDPERKGRVIGHG